MVPAPDDPAPEPVDEPVDAEVDGEAGDDGAEGDDDGEPELDCADVPGLVGEPDVPDGHACALLGPDEAEPEPEPDADAEPEVEPAGLEADPGDPAEALGRQVVDGVDAPPAGPLVVPAVPLGPTLGVTGAGTVTSPPPVLPVGRSNH